MQPVRWGVLGASKFAREHMAPAIHMAKGAKLAALATSWAEKAQEFQEFCPDLTVHSSYDALLADPDIDAVYIPLPNHLHVMWTLKALAAGKHVLTEKPIAMHAREIDQIIVARDNARKLAAEAYMIVFHPQWQRAREIVQSGAIGRVTHVDTAFTYDNRADLQNIRNRADAGGGGIRDIGAGDGHDGGAAGQVHLFGHDLDAALPPAGGDVPGRQGDAPRRQRALQRQCA